MAQVDQFGGQVATINTAWRAIEAATS